MNMTELVQNKEFSPLRKESYANKETKFTDYIDKKVKSIQEVKIKTIKTCEKYFQDLKEKTEKYLLKEQKRIINSFEDNINMSLNCVTHNYLYSFDNLCIKRNDTHKNQNQEKNEPECNQSIKIKTIENQNELSVKLQMKKILEEIIFAENHLNEKLKLIGEDLKKEIQKLIEPLRELLSKISKFTQIDNNVSTLIVPESKNELQKKNNKGVKKSKKDTNVKNPEILAEKKRIAKINELEENFNYEITDKLLKKSHIKSESFEVGEKLLLELKPVIEKEDLIVTTINKMVKNLKLVEFDLVNKKSVLHIYEKIPTEILENPQQNVRPEQENENEVELKVQHEIYLNEKKLKIDDNENNWNYEKHTKISFESKPDREYLMVMSSKIEEVQINQLTRKMKIFQFSIFNYKGDLITKELINELRISESEKIVEVIQIESFKDYIFLIFNNHLIRLNLKNIKSRKSLLYGTDEKIIKVSTCGDKLIVFEGRKMVVELLTVEFVLLQRFSLSSYYPNDVRLHNLINLRLTTAEKQESEKVQNEITLMIPNVNTNSVHYIQNGFQKCLHFSYSNTHKTLKQKTQRLEQIQSIVCIDHEIYLVVSSGFNLLKPKTDLFLLELTTENDDIEKSLTGKVSYLDTLNEDIADCKFIKNQLYFKLRSGKINSFCIY